MKIILITLFLGFMRYLSAQNGTEMPLYADKIPNSKEAKNSETSETRANGTRFISRTVLPTLTVFIPEKPNGKAVIICPASWVQKQPPNNCNCILPICK